MKGVVLGFREAMMAWVIVLSLAACAPGAGLPPMPPTTAGDYRLAANDQLRVIVYDEPQMTNVFIVSSSGAVALPLLGTVSARGLTTREVATAITTQLVARGLRRDPSVSVEIDKYRTFSILGEIARPGQYVYQPGMTMLDAVAAAGGFTYRSVTGYASDVRTAADGPVEGKLRPGEPIAPGDVITIFERYF